MKLYLPFAAALLLAAPSLAKNPNWPNGPSDDPLDAVPDDGGYIHFDGEGNVTGGQWNLWSFVPTAWQKKMSAAEIALGTGMHADRAWQRTIGDRRVVIAVLDSGIKWDEGGLTNKFYLSKGELAGGDPTKCRPKQPDPPAADIWDVNGDGIFNIADYLHADPTIKDTFDAAGNQNGRLDPGDLIAICSDGVDDDGNGFTDDISGWDSFRGDNDPADDTRYGHGSGEARDSGEAGNDGSGGIGVCPECTLLMVRTGDSFVVDANDFANSVVFAVDSGASVIQEALGAVNNTRFTMSAIEYAYRNNVVIIASAADELSFHHNVPGTNNHTVYVHAVVYDGSKAEKSTTFLNFNNCTNFGGQLLLSTPGSGCSSEATGITSGHAGLIYSAGLKGNVSPPLSAEELRGILIQSVDDIDIPGSADDPEKFPSGPGWDLHFGYGRNNARKSVDLVLDDQIPPEADIDAPSWFEPIEVRLRPTVDVTGRVGARTDGQPNRYDNYAWSLKWAKGVDPKGGWTEIASGAAAVGGATPGTLATWDVAEAAKAIDFTVPLKDPHQYSVTLRLEVRTQHNGKELYNEFRKTVHLFKDETLLPGYPKQLGSSIESSGKVFDVDGDGKEEYLLPTTDGLIHALKHDGTEAAGFPAKVDLRPSMDSKDPFYVGNACAFQPLDKKGQCKPQGWIDPEFNRQSMMGTPAVGALTGDKTDLSIVVLTWEGFAYVFDTAGQVRPGWPQRTNPDHVKDTSPNRTLDDGFFAAPVLYDMDGDGDLEIIAAAMDAYVYVWHHDGSPMAGWPVQVHDPMETQRARIICTPAVGDADGDGHPEIAVGTNEVYGAGGAENEARGYLLKHTGSPDPEDILPALEEGWPVYTTGLIVNTLPLVGRGTPTNPAMADLDGDGDLEIHMDAIAFTPTFWHHTGEQYETVFDNLLFGDKSDSNDFPTFTLMNNATIARIEPGGNLAIIKGTAGLDFALTFAEGGKKAVFDHQLSAWDTKTGYYLDGFPRVVDDWMFFMNPTVVDLDGDGNPDILNGTGGYLLHAYNYEGKEPAGFPKMLGGWIITSPTFGDLTGDGKWDVVDGTRAGWVFAWKTDGPTSKKAIQWQNYAHDFHNTNNYEEPVGQYNDYPEGGTGTGGDTDAGTTGGGPDAGTTGGDSDAGAITGDDASTGGTGDGGSIGGDAGGSGGTTGTTAPAATGGSSDDGCQVGTHSAPGAAAIVLALLLMLGVLRRRAVA